MHNVIDRSHYPFPQSPLRFHILLLSRIIYLPFAKTTEGISEKQEFFLRLTPGGAEFRDTCVVNRYYWTNINCAFPLVQHKKKG